MEFPRAIESPTATDLADKSIIELAQNVYNNALAAQESADAAAVVGQQIDRAREYADVAQNAAADAAVDAVRAETAEENASRDAALANADAMIAQQAADNAANIVDQKIAEFALTVVPKPEDTKPYFRIPILTSQGLIDYHPVSYSNPQDGYIPMFKPNGALVVGAPTANNHATNKQYVDGVLAQANAFDGTGNYPNLIAGTAGRLDVAFTSVNRQTFYGELNRLYVVQATCDTLTVTLLVSTFGNGRSATFGRANGINGYFDAYNGDITCVYYDGSSTSPQYGTINKVYRLGV